VVWLAWYTNLFLKFKPLWSGLLNIQTRFCSLSHSGLGLLDVQTCFCSSSHRGSGLFDVDSTDFLLAAEPFTDTLFDRTKSEGIIERISAEFGSIWKSSDIFRPSFALYNENERKNGSGCNIIIQSTCESYSQYLCNSYKYIEQHIDSKYRWTHNCKKLMLSANSYLVH